MTLRARCVLPGVCCALLCFSVIAIGDEDDKPADSSRRSAQSGLNNEQQRAAGIAVAHPIAAKAPERIEALGLVLDATLLISDMGDAAVAAVAEHSASAELARLHALHAGGAVRGIGRAGMELARLHDLAEWCGTAELALLVAIMTLQVVALAPSPPASGSARSAAG